MTGSTKKLKFPVLGCDLHAVSILRRHADQSLVYVYVLNYQGRNCAMMAFRGDGIAAGMTPVSKQSFSSGYVLVQLGNQFSVEVDVLRWAYSLVDDGVDPSEAACEAVGLFYAVKAVGGGPVVAELMVFASVLGDIKISEKVAEYVASAPRDHFSATQLREQRDLVAKVVQAWVTANPR